jgi:hypothetical protein
MRPGTNGILETCLYVEDVRRSVDCYEQIFGFSKWATLGKAAAQWKLGPSSCSCYSGRALPVE